MTIPIAKGMDPIFLMREAEAYTGETSKTLRRRARADPPQLEIIHLNPRRDGIRKSVLDRYMASKEVVGAAPRKNK